MICKIWQTVQPCIELVVLLQHCQYAMLRNRHGTYCHQHTIACNNGR